MDRKTKGWLLLMAGAAYTLFPIDVFPDAIPFLGNLDDLILMLLAGKLAFPMLRPEKGETIKPVESTSVPRT